MLIEMLGIIGSLIEILKDPSVPLVAMNNKGIFDKLKENDYIQIGDNYVRL